MPPSEPEAYVGLLLDRIEACVEYSEHIHSKGDVLDLVSELRTQNAYIERGSDDFRIKFVSTQGTVEHVLACAQALGEITELVGVIHTPTPTTPLCTRPNEDPAGLLDPSIAHDLDKLLTVRSRAQIVREYLHKGGKLYVVYPEGGFERRSAEQQTIYTEELATFPDQLFDWVLPSDLLDPEMVGATYLFRDRSENLYAFSIKAKQANDPHDDSEWGLWFGAVTSPVVIERIHEVFDYLDSAEGPNVREEMSLTRA